MQPGFSPLGLSASLAQAPAKICNFVMSLCTLSIASINAFSKVCSSFLPLGQDPRQDVTICIDGHQIPMMYGTGAAATCLTLKTYLKYFPHAKRLNHKTKLLGAGNYDLNIYGIYTLPSSYKDRLLLDQHEKRPSLLSDDLRQMQTPKS